MSDNVRNMYIDGKWVLAEGGATFDVVNPADQSVVASVANGATPEILRAEEATEAAFKEWSLLAPKERGRFLLAIQELMEEPRDEPARLITLENGKPFEEAQKEGQFSLGYFGWFNVLTTSRSRLVGNELLTHPLIRKIGFTGSTEVGKWIMRMASKQIKRLSFELGGNAPFIVFDDADLPRAVEYTEVKSVVVSLPS